MSRGVLITRTYADGSVITARSWQELITAECELRRQQREADEVIAALTSHERNASPMRRLLSWLRW